MTEAANHFRTGNKTVLLLGRSDNTVLTYEMVQRIQVAGVALSPFWIAHRNAGGPEQGSKQGCLYNTYQY